MYLLLSSACSEPGGYAVMTGAVESAPGLTVGKWAWITLDGLENGGLPPPLWEEPESCPRADWEATGSFCFWGLADVILGQEEERLSRSLLWVSLPDPSWCWETSSPNLVILKLILNQLFWSMTRKGKPVSQITLVFYLGPWNILLLDRWK